MKNAIKFLLSFSIGGGIGYLISYQISKKNFEKRLDTEMSSMKKMYSNPNEEKCQISDDDSSIVSEKVADSGVLDADMQKEYTNYTEFYRSKKGNEVPDQKDNAQRSTINKPYIISSDDFGNMGYSEVSLIYYSDDILTEDGSDEKLSINKIIGKENIKHLKKHTEDAIYIRNESIKTDYEILLDKRKYADVFEETDSTDEE